MKISKREDGKWVLDFTLNRKRVRKVIEGTKRMAEQAKIIEKEKIFKQIYGIPGKKKNIRFEEYTKIYEENYSKERRGYKNELYIIKKLNSFFKDKYLNEITPGDIERYRSKRKDEVSNTSVNLELSKLKAIFNKAIDTEDYGILRNPVNKVEFLEKVSHKERFLSIKEMESLLKAAHTPWSSHLPLFLVIALNTGMRKMEILSLKWENVNFKKRYIEVTREIAKSKKSRKVPMNDIVYKELKNIERKSQYVFYNPKKKTHIKNIKTAFWRACSEAGIENLRVHDLRHTAASFLVNECGISVPAVAEILGHSNIEMTMQYVHQTDEQKQKGVDRLGEIFNTAWKKSRHKVDM